MNFGRLRPLHTSAVIFAFGGNALIATSFYVVQRTSAARLWGGNLAWFVFWGYQLVHRAGRHGLYSGCHAVAEYAEPEWYDRLVADHRLGGLSGGLPRHHRQAPEPHIYVANWFYLASSSPSRCCMSSTT